MAFALKQLYFFRIYLEWSLPSRYKPGCSVSIVTDYGLDLCVQTGSGAHPAFYTMGTGGSFPRPGRDANHSPSSAEVKKA
jgi:hypothetical protein